MTWKRSFLVVANVTATSEELIEALEQRAAHEPATFTLVIPATPFGGGRAAAVQKLEEALEQLRAAGLEAQGERRQRRPDPGGDRRMGSQALRRDHRLDAADASLEMDARRAAGADRQTDRCDGDTRGLASRPGPSTWWRRRPARPDRAMGPLSVLSWGARKAVVTEPPSSGGGPCDNRLRCAWTSASILTAMVTPFDADGPGRRGRRGRLDAPPGRARLGRTGYLRHDRRGVDPR